MTKFFDMIKHVKRYKYVDVTMTASECVERQIIKLKKIIRKLKKVIKKTKDTIEENT